MTVRLTPEKVADIIVCCSDRCMTLSYSAKSELYWWVDLAGPAYNVIHHMQPEITLSSDASNLGWGCACTDSQSGGEGLPEESSFHINYLELKAACFALKSFQRGSRQTCPHYDR